MKTNENGNLKPVDPVDGIPTTVEEIDSIISNIKNGILLGFIDPLQLAVKLKAIEKLNELRKDPVISEAILKEAQRYGEKSFRAFGAKIETRMTGVKYDYKGTNFSRWTELNFQKNRIEEQLKKIEEMLKTIPPEGIVWAETGEMVYAPAKTGSTSVIITLDKTK